MKKNYVSLMFLLFGCFFFGQSFGQTLLDVSGGIKVGDTPQNMSGIIRYNGDLQVYKNSEWVSLTTQPEDLPLGTWVPAVTTSFYTNPCARSCEDSNAGTASADPDGFICKGSNGNRGIIATNDSDPNNNPYCAGSQLAQCYCLVNSNNNITTDNTLEKNMETIKVLKSQNESMQRELL